MSETQIAALRAVAYNLARLSIIISLHCGHKNTSQFFLLTFIKLFVSIPCESEGFCCNPCGASQAPQGQKFQDPLPFLSWTTLPGTPVTVDVFASRHIVQGKVQASLRSWPRPGCPT